jgi:hypothetical protein
MSVKNFPLRILDPELNEWLDSQKRTGNSKNTIINDHLMKIKKAEEARERRLKKQA